jgi:beta-phosphoglucomutase-like phosphatase (HAD superfamily)
LIRELIGKLKLVIFDIDGTLTQTNRVDEICFLRALAETHGIVDAARLGLAFVGVADGARAETLREAGAKHVIVDFEDAGRFFELLEEAEVPAP